MQDVESPPPLLFLRDPDAYLAQVEAAQCAPGTVILRYLRHAGLPILQWQRAAREGNGLKVKQLFAYSFHIFRTCHKPVCAQVVLIALLGFCCALPALQTVLLATVSLSLLGRRGSNMYIDRLLETINKIQQGSKRSSNAAAFARAIDMTTLLRSILHVRHAFQASETGAAQSDDPVTENMLRMARLLQDALVQTIGCDLTLYCPSNLMWHTGNAVPLYTGDFRYRRPWEWIWRVAFGRSCGKHRSRHEMWHAFAERFVDERLFPF